LWMPVTEIHASGLTSGVNQCISLGTARITGPVTVFLSAQAGYGGSGASFAATGWISARRWQ